MQGALEFPRAETDRDSFDASPQLGPAAGCCPQRSHHTSLHHTSHLTVPAVPSAVAAALTPGREGHALEQGAPFDMAVLMTPVVSCMLMHHGQPWGDAVWKIDSSPCGDMRG